MSDRTRTGVLQVVLFSIAALLFGYAAATPAGAVGGFEREAQVWWDKTGIVIPSRVGEHEHVAYTVPSSIRRGETLTVPMRLTLHDTKGPTNWLRIYRTTSSSNIEVWKRTLALPPCPGTCTQDITASITNTSAWPVGRVELRISLNIPDEDPALSGSQRMYQSTGEQVCVDLCTPHYRSQPTYTEARGWYQGRGYQNARRTSASIYPRVTVSLNKGSGGLATKFSGLFIDPRMHDGDPGIVVDPCPLDTNPMGCNGPFSGTVTLPALSGTHTLVMVASDGQLAGVQAETFTAP